MDVLLQKERERTANMMTEVLVAYNNQPGGLNSSVRGMMSGFDQNIMLFPGIFSYIKENEGKPVGKKHYVTYGRTHFEPIPQEEASELLGKKNHRDYSMMVIEETNGQLGPNDSKCYITLEQIIYREINDNYLRYLEGAVEGPSQEVQIGTMRQFTSQALNDKSGTAYKMVEGFFHRIKGLGFTPIVAKGFGLKYKTENGADAVIVDDYLKPFPGSRFVGKEGGNQKLNLKVDNRVILNILHGGTKMQYDEVINAITCAKSKHLLRMLTMLDKKSSIFIDYTDFVQIFELKRYYHQSQVERQIGLIANPINYDPQNKILIGGKKDSPDRPFGVKPLKKDNWQLVFKLNAFSTPNMETYVSKTKVQSEAVSMFRERRKLLLEVRQEAAEHGLSPEEYVLTHGDVALIRLRGLAAEEVAGIIRHFEMKADKHRLWGERLFKACGETGAKGIVKQMEAKQADELAEERRLQLEQEVLQAKQRRRGRPFGSVKPKKLSASEDAKLEKQLPF